MDPSRLAAIASALLWPALFLCSMVLAGSARIAYLLPAVRPRRPRRHGLKQNATAYILVVLGSGGHTTEMFMLLDGLNTALYSCRRYVISEGDNHSITRMQDFETALEKSAAQQGKTYGAYDYKIVARARKIHQGLFTAPISTIATFNACLRVFDWCLEDEISPPRYPDLVIANGPATAFVVICAAFTLRFLGLPGTKDTLKCVYVESWARLHRLSLTGRLLRITGLCERFLVQWPGLEARVRRRQLGEYHGPLVI